MPKIAAIPASRLRRVFEKAGFKCVRTEGDHFVYTKPGVPRPVVIPDWTEVPVRNLFAIPMFIQKISYEIELAVDQCEDFNLIGEDFINKPI